MIHVEFLTPSVATVSTRILPARDAAADVHRIRDAGPVGPHGRPRLRGPDSLPSRESPGPQAGASQASGQKRHLLLPVGRALPHRLLRSQAPAGQGSGRADAVQDRTDHVQPGRRHLPQSLEVQALRKQRHPGQRPLSPYRQRGRRVDGGPLHDRQVHVPRPGQLLFSLGDALCRVPQHGRVDQLRPGQREPEPARIRGVGQRRDSVGGHQHLRQRISLGRPSRFVHLSPTQRTSRQHSSPGIGLPPAPADRLHQRLGPGISGFRRRTLAGGSRHSQL